MLENSFKAGDRTKPSNYRPISILPAIGKVFEKIIYSRIVSFVNKEKVLTKNQFGFRDQRSTIYALVELVENLRSN